MTIRPILFSGPMVRALLEGRKTQTRRVLNRARVFETPETSAFTLTGPEMKRALQNASRFRHLGGDGWFWESDAFGHQAPATRTGWMAHIGYAPHDLLYVRETWSVHWANDDIKPSEVINDAWSVKYDAEGTIRAATRDGSLAENEQFGVKRPSIFMPRWASRLTLKVTDVRVQQLHDISEEDAKAEGCNEGAQIEEVSGIHEGWSARTEFHHLWDSLNEKRGFGWSVNPWIVAVSFEVHLCNVDAFKDEVAA